MIRLACACLLLASPALAADDCGELATLLSTLKSEYGERVAAGGVENLGGGLIVTVNPVTGSYTILRGVNGTACMIAAGTQWAIAGEPA